MIYLITVVAAFIGVILYVHFSGRTKNDYITDKAVNKVKRETKQARKKALKIWGNNYPPRSMTATERAYYALYRNFRHYDETKFLLTLNTIQNELEGKTTAAN